MAEQPDLRYCTADDVEKLFEARRKIRSFLALENFKINTRNYDLCSRLKDAGMNGIDLNLHDLQTGHTKTGLSMSIISNQ